MTIPGVDRIEGLIQGAKTATTKLSQINPTEVSVFDPDQFLEKSQTKEYLDEKLGKRTGKDLPAGKPARNLVPIVTGKGAE